MKFYSKVLQGLDRILRFDGQLSSLDRMDVASDIQPVYDMARMAELAAIVTDPGAGGFFSVDQDNTHVGGDLIESSVDPYANLDRSWGRIGERWVWLMQFAGSSSDTAVMGVGSGAVLSASLPALGNAITRRDYLLAAWAAFDRVNITTSLSATFQAALVAQTAVTVYQQPFGIKLPFPLFPGSLLTWRTNATAAVAGKIRFEALCWIGPFGVYPPGMR